jgi:hypothetical protein
MRLSAPAPRTGTGPTRCLLLATLLAAVLVPAAGAPYSYAAVTARGTTLALAGAGPAGAPAPFPRLRMPAPPPAPLDPRAMYGWWMDGNVPTWLGPDGKMMAMWWGCDWWCGGWRVDGRTVRAWGRYWSPDGGASADVTYWIMYPDMGSARRLQRPAGDVMPVVPVGVLTLPIPPPTVAD